MIETKEELRKKYIQIRKNIKNKKEKSDKIFNKIINLEEYKSAIIIAFYKNLASEVETTRLIEYSISNGKIVVLPKAVDNFLKFYKINSINDNFEKSEFGIEEPFENINNLINSNKIDLIIVPGVCFDKYKNRIGFGKGYYDRFLERKTLKNIAICFEEQVIKNEKIPVTDNDIKVDKIVTDQNIYI